MSYSNERVPLLTSQPAPAEPNKFCFDAPILGVSITTSVANKYSVQKRGL